MTAQDDAIGKLASQFATSIVEALKGTPEEEPAEDPIEAEEPLDEDTHYIEHLHEVFKEMENSEAILIIALVDQGGFFRPKIIQSSKDPLLTQLLNIQLAYLAASNYENMVKETMEHPDDLELEEEKQSVSHSRGNLP